MSTLGGRTTVSLKGMIGFDTLISILANLHKQTNKQMILTFYLGLEKEGKIAVIKQLDFMPGLQAHPAHTAVGGWLVLSFCPYRRQTGICETLQWTFTTFKQKDS